MFDSNKKIVYQDTLDEYHKRISALIGTGGSQISTMPTASEDYENVIYQYIGATNATYTNGYFYKCIEDPDNSGEYIWVNEQVQDGGSSGGGHEIEDSSGTSLTQRDTLQFAGDFEVSDDSTNEKTVVAPHELTNEDMAEIMSTLPGSPVKGIKYSTTEQVIGEWIDGKPLYQKTVTLSTSKSISSTAWTSIGLEKGTVKTVLSAYGNNIYSGTGAFTLFGYLLAAVVDDEIKFMACRDASVLDVTYITLQYTKTTD